MAFSDLGELHHALESKVVTLHTKIRGRFKSVDEDGKPYSKIYETTPGRLLIGELLPKNGKVPFDICNQEMTKKNISKMIDTVYRHCGQKDTVIFCDRIMKASDVRAFTADQLKDELAKLKKEQFNLRFQKATGQLEKSSRINEVRKDIARVKTIARQKAAEVKA